MGVNTPLEKEPRPMDATVAAMKRKNFADFLRKSFLVKIFAHLPSGGSPRALPGGERKGVPSQLALTRH